jgi:hypothetical protein
MRPAFSSTKSAAVFATLLLLLLLSPVLAGKKFLPPRDEYFTSQNWDFGATHWIFEERGDIDVAFVGSSHIYNAINTPYVQDKLTQTLGRRTVVRTIAWGGAGYDALFFMTRDLLAHRKVRMLVFYDEIPFGKARSNKSITCFRWDEDHNLICDLPLFEQKLMYLGAILSMPLNIINLARPHFSDWAFTNQDCNGRSSVITPNKISLLRDLPSMPLTYGMPYAFNCTMNDRPFKSFEPAKHTEPNVCVVYSSETKTNFVFTHEAPEIQQVHFARIFSKLLQEHGVVPVMLHVPLFSEARSPVIQERIFWPEIFGKRFSMIGIPPTKLFGSLSDSELSDLYGEAHHLNQNGQEYFTRLITPTLLKIYETTTNH